MQPLNLATIPLEGVNLIEASAGTGKTFTIAGLFLRLLLEKQLGVDEILVVTFTEAATAELRERIRERIAEAERAFVKESSDDPTLAPLLANSNDQAADALRLRHALLTFDRAAIYTIHGFCQRILRDNAFESAGPFEQEILPEQGELLKEIANDFWRIHVQPMPAPLIEAILANGVTPEALAQQTRALLAKPYLEVRGGETGADEFEGLRQAYGASLNHALGLWQEGHGEIREQLQPGRLNRTMYKAETIEPLLEQIKAMDAETLPSLDEKFERLGITILKKKTNKGEQPPDHPFFSAWDRVLEDHACWLEGGVRFRNSLLRTARDFFEQELERRKQQTGMLAYDDMLLRVHQTLTSDQGKQAAHAMARTYQAALIDEFQDTDPLQYAIFDTLFGLNHDLFLVGDPKQAIYSFRGADIFAYLTARQHAHNHYTLETNWRSTPGMVEGCNSLLKQREDPFLFEEIQFHPVKPNQKSSKGDLVDPNGSALPLNIWFLPAPEGGSKPHSKESARPLIEQHCAAEIQRLLEAGSEGDARLADRPLCAGDIAILVRTNQQANQMVEVLRQWGIAAVSSARGSVFDSREASELERVLYAIHAPHQEGLLRGALSSSLFGLDAHALERLSSDEQQLAEQLARFAQLRRRWLEGGFYAMFSHLLEGEGVALRLLALQDGERRLTNLRHLGELLHNHHRQQQPPPQGLLQWFSRQLQQEQGMDESELRLESDAQLVQVLTIHKSKGLEYPVIFCPYTWDGILRDPGNEPLRFHDPKEAYRPILDFGSAGYGQGKLQYWQEELAESQRLFYVAVTRAKYRCYLGWGNISGNGASPLGLLLHGELPTLEEKWPNTLGKRLAKLGDAGLMARLESLHQAAPQAIGIHQLPTTAPQPRPLPEGAPPTLAEARAIHRRIDAIRRLTSFTALTRDLGHGDPELPDRDPLPTTSPEPEPLEPANPGLRTIMTFPRGAQAGSCLHHLFERIDFTSDRDKIPAQAERSLRQFGFEPEWSGVIANMAEEVLDTPLDGQECRLRRVGNHQRLVEMEFYFPWQGLDGKGLSKTLQDHWPAMPAAYASTLARIDARSIQGFMHGFIDLIFELDGHYYLADYKSNHLGEHARDYQADALVTAMADHHYFLQYLIYTLALHRYLNQRLKGYSYRDHFGGVYYLFLRGIRTELGPASGVHFDKPPESLIIALDEMIGKPLGRR